MAPEVPSNIQHDEQGHKFYTVIDGQEAHVTYQPAGAQTFDFQHTYVPEELRGRHVAEDLVRHALDETLRRGYRFIPSCPYVRRFIERHPEYQKGVAA